MVRVELVTAAVMVPLLVLAVLVVLFMVQLRHPHGEGLPRAVVPLSILVGCLLLVFALAAVSSVSAASANGAPRECPSGTCSR